MKVRYTVLRGKEAYRTLNEIKRFVEAVNNGIEDAKREAIAQILGSRYAGDGWVQLNGEWYHLWLYRGALRVYGEGNYPVDIAGLDCEKILSLLASGEVYGPGGHPRLYAPLRIKDAPVLGEEEVELR